MNSQEALKDEEEAMDGIQWDDGSVSFLMICCSVLLCVCAAGYQGDGQLKERERERERILVGEVRAVSEGWTDLSRHDELEGDGAEGAARAATHQLGLTYQRRLTNQ